MDHPRLILFNQKEESIHIQKDKFFQAINNGFLGPYLQQSNKQIDQIVKLVRGSLSKMARITLGALIVIDVHGKLNVRNIIASVWCKSLLKYSSSCWEWNWALVVKYTMLYTNWDKGLTPWHNTDIIKQYKSLQVWETLKVA